MRRIVLASLIFTPCIALGLFLTGKSWAEKPVALKGYRRSATFEVTNSTKPRPASPHVNGVGKFPVRLKVTDIGSTPKARHLQVLVVVHARAHPTRLRAGEIVQMHADPSIMTTAGAEQQRSAPFEADIPLPPGDYVARVFLCDPDEPYEPRPNDVADGFPEPDKFPGLLLKGTAMSVHVDPAK